MTVPNRVILRYRFSWRRFWRWFRLASCALLALAAVGYLLGAIALVAWVWSRWP